METRYRITFTQGDSTFEIESTDRVWLEKKEKEYLRKLSAIPRKGRSPRVIEAGAEPGGKGEIAAPAADLSITEFFREYVAGKRVSSRTRIAVFFVYYLQKVQKKGEVSTGDVGNCFKEVSYPGYNKLNMTDILRRARRQALLNYVNKVWSITTTGEDFVLNTVAGKEE
jgi:hypothetical protein